MTYRLDGTTPVPCSASEVEIGTAVGRTRISSEIFVSTSFLGLDHNFAGTGGPVLFETLVMGGPADGYSIRYRTWAEAQLGHAKVVSEVMAVNQLVDRPAWINGEET